MAERAAKLADPEAEQLLDIDEVCAFFGGTRPLHPATIYRGAGTIYPRPIKVGPNTSRWLRSECVTSLNQIIAQRAA
jgi:predicted DNA-binding transcriptional regulator AlpA